MKKENILFKDYLVSQNRQEYDRLINASKFNPVDHFNIGSLMNNYNFGKVKDTQYLITYEGLTWFNFVNELWALNETSEIQIGNTPIFFVQEARVFLLKEVERINKFEGDNLGHEPTPEETNADIARFGIFKTFPQFDLLAGGDLLKFESIKELDYMLAFTKLHYEAMKTAYQLELNEIYKRKNEI